MLQPKLDSPTENSLELLSTALDHAGQGVLIANNEGSILYVNPHLCEYTGYRADELIGKNPRILQSGSTSRETYLLLWNTISSGRTWHGEMQNRRKDGEFFWERVTISPIKNVTGNITHFIAIIEDISNEKLLDEELSKLERQNLQVGKRESISTLTKRVVSDFNDVLTSIMGNTYLALDQGASKESVQKRLRKILESVKRGTEIGKEYLEFTGFNQRNWVILCLGCNA